MKTQASFHHVLGALLVGAVSLASTCALAQGVLSPPPGGPAPTMKTLEQIEPRSPISSLPFTITNAGSYYLTTNLTGISGANGITIASDNVTLDLNGFTLLGVAGSSNAIYVANASPSYHFNITVRNGTIDYWDGDGINAANNAENSVFENLSISRTGNIGIEAYGSLVRNCVCDSCGNSGIVAASSEVMHCVANYMQAWDGIDAYNSKVLDCVCEYNATNGIYVQNSTVSGCRTEGNGTSGIYVDSGYGSGSRVTDNTSLGDNADGTPGEAGMAIYDSNTRVENNHITGGGFAGILIGNSTTNNVIVKNTLSNNGTAQSDNIVASGNQIVGPLITTTGTITETSPWANFSF